jgi:hypothetical protein
MKRIIMGRMNVLEAFGDGDGDGWMVKKRRRCGYPKITTFLV